MDEIPILKTENKETPQNCNGIFTFVTALKVYLKRVESKEEEQTMPLNEQYGKRFTWK